MANWLNNHQSNKNKNIKLINWFIYLFIYIYIKYIFIANNYYHKTNIEKKIVILYTKNTIVEIMNA